MPKNEAPSGEKPADIISTGGPVYLRRYSPGDPQQNAQIFEPPNPQKIQETRQARIAQYNFSNLVDQVNRSSADRLGMGIVSPTDSVGKDSVVIGTSGLGRVFREREGFSLALGGKLTREGKGLITVAGDTVVSTWQNNELVKEGESREIGFRESGSRVLMATAIAKPAQEGIGSTIDSGNASIELMATLADSNIVDANNSVEQNTTKHMVQTIERDQQGKIVYKRLGQLDDVDSKLCVVRNGRIEVINNLDLNTAGATDLSVLLQNSAQGLDNAFIINTDWLNKIQGINGRIPEKIDHMNLLESCIDKKTGNFDQQKLFQRIKNLKETGQIADDTVTHVLNLNDLIVKKAEEATPSPVQKFLGLFRRN